MKKSRLEKFVAFRLTANDGGPKSVSVFCKQCIKDATNMGFKLYDSTIIEGFETEESKKLPPCCGCGAKF